MYIAPSSVIYILTDVPLDKTYDHTLWWPKVEGGASLQEAYFRTKIKYTFSDQTYQRAGKGTLRISTVADNLYDCNYLMFRNTTFGTKWFYAFIKKVTYINNNVSEIEYEIDSMQTWYFEVNLRECLVEREHTATDNIGDNLVPENLELGEYVSEAPISTAMYTNVLYIVIAATWRYEAATGSYIDYGGGTYAGMFTGLCYNIFTNDSQGRQEAADCILNAGSKSDGIVAVFFAPMLFYTTGDPSPIQISVNKHLTDFDGYTPHNNKLYTYPYNFLYITNYQGNSAIYRYEFFKDSEGHDITTCPMSLKGDFSPSTSVMLYPKNYKGVGENYDEMIQLKGYPQVAYATDAYKAWLAQNSASLTTSLVTSLATPTMAAMGTMAVGGALATVAPELVVAGALVGAIVGAGRVLAQVYQHSIMPDQAHGNQGGTMMIANGLLAFGLYPKHITGEFARIIDGFFDMYGYACHKVKVPNTCVRNHWTYTKTIGCKIVGNIPCDEEEKICKIYDKGITFWVNPNEVGDYSLDNRLGGT